MEKPCAVCGRVFAFPPSHQDRRHTCSKKCAGLRRRRRVARRCIVCGKLFERPAWAAKVQKTCSKACENLRRSHRARKRCPLCGKSFEVPWCRRHKATYCSLKCLQRSKAKVRHKPTPEQLSRLIERLTLKQIADQYDVTPNAVRYWCKVLQVHIPSRKERNDLRREHAREREPKHISS